MIRTVHHRPPDASAGPRFTGPRTFLRLPYVQTTEDVDLAVVGVPTDDAVSFRSGARFGPEAVRSASVLLRPYNPHLAVDVVERLSMVDRHAGGRRADEQPGARLHALADRDRLSRLRLRRGVAAVRPERHHGLAGGERLPRDDLARCAARDGHRGSVAGLSRRASRAREPMSSLR
jgi:hypothetical protein